MQLPITTDYAAAKLFLNSIDTDIIPTQGTAIGSALDLCQESFVGNDNKHKVIVLITDGENHEDDPITAAKKAGEAGVIVHAIGMGSPEGVPVPVYRNGSQVDYLRDRDGNTVLTKLDEMTLQQIAAETKGEYIRATNSDDGLTTVINAIGRMEKKQFGTKQYSDYEDRFQYLLAFSLLLLVLESLFSAPQKRSAVPAGYFGEKKQGGTIIMMIASITLRFQLLAMSLLMLQAPTHTLAQSERKLVREGNTAYEAKKFDQAEIQYRKSLEKNKTSSRHNTTSETHCSGRINSTKRRASTNRPPT